MRAKLLRDMPGIVETTDKLGRSAYHRFVHSAGDVIESSDCWMLVTLGVAKPDDEECFLASGKMTDEQIAEAGRHYEANDAGILREHRQLFLDGKITGYEGESGHFIVTDKFTEEDAAAFPEDSPPDLLPDEEDRE